jgi:hypothetical protein
MTDRLPDPVYRCAECEMPVIFHNGAVIRACAHQEAGVTASISATCYGESEICE